MAVANPVAFRPLSVTFWTTVVYLALLIPLVVIHETVPQPPSSPTLYAGLNLTEAWFDLTELTRNYHSIGSRANDQVHDWLLLRLTEIVRSNGANASQVRIFDDRASNLTMTQMTPPISGYKQGDPSVGTGHYWEASNVMVYIRGRDDPPGDWWESDVQSSVIGKGGVLVNAHYDSVSTGYGATDDGMGVITILQLVQWFSSPGNQPQRGIVALLNNGEEDFLWGARVFGKTRLMPFCHTFLNLEGAGAGGRATLFRASDAEVVNAYRKTPSPFSSVIASDAFGLGAVRSQTDYVVFNSIYGLRGLDLAFYRPRARYHTNQDDARHASRASLWHMLINSLHTMQSLSGDTGDTFIGQRSDGDRNKVANGWPTDGVWFDLFGKSLALFELRSMFAWSLALLIASPLILALLTYLLVRSDKYYFFAGTKTAYEGSVLDPIQLYGRRGIFRFPFALIVAGALVVGSAYLLAKVNPLVVYSNEYTVWAMMTSLFYFFFWLIMAGANAIRPSALSRGFALIWLFVISWAVLVVTTVFEDRFRIAGGYLFVFLHSAVFLATAIALLEHFALPTKTTFATAAHDDHEVRDHIAAVPHADDLISPHPIEADNDDADAEPSETTPLVRSRSGENRQTTFTSGYRRSFGALIDKTRSATSATRGKPYEHEQAWSGKLPSWLWVVQFLLLGPFILIITAQAGLLLLSAISQTGIDGGSLVMPYLLAAFFAILVLLPITPFIHRIPHHLPLLLLVVFVATLIYNLTVTPFNAESRYKVYFKQTIDLDTGLTTIQYSGIEEYVRAIVAELPSAMGKELHCSEKSSLRSGLTTCSYDGVDVPPDVVDRDNLSLPIGIPPRYGYRDWVSLNTTRLDTRTVRFDVDVRASRVCRLDFDLPVADFSVHGGTPRDERYGVLPDGGLRSIQLYRRTWDTPWSIDVVLRESGGMDGRVVCSWDDANEKGAMPAFDEAIAFAPAWAAITKTSTGLVDGSVAFKV